MHARRAFPLLSLAALLVVALVCAAPPPHAGADPQGLLHMEIDADPTNGTRPCSPVDATRALAAVSGTYTIAICADDNSTAPPSAFAARVIWSGGVASAIELPDIAPSFDDNPDFNQAPGPTGNASSDWNCSGTDLHYPAGDWAGSPETDAFIICSRSNATIPGELTAMPGLLATITMQASGAGTETYELTSDGVSAIAYATEGQFTDHVCGYEVACPGAVVTQGSSDTDGDGVGDDVDNCPLTPNPGQQNADREIDNGPGIATRDITVPNAVSDADGDACETDGDADNDGLPGTEDTEPLGAVGVCGGFPGANDLHSSPAGGDITNDDNGNGIPAPADLADSGPSWDTDNDGALDGVECTLDKNPRSSLPLSKPTAPQCGGATDADGDGLPASSERCKWGTSDVAVSGLDSDGDGKKDCVEANDTNGDGVQNFPGDTIASAKAANGIIGKTLDFDLNGDGVVNFPGDTILSAKLVNHVGGICI